MKKKLMITILVSLLLNCNFICSQESNHIQIEYLINLQEKIHEAYEVDAQNERPDELLKIERDLKSLNSQSFLTKYWSAYNKLYLSVYLIVHGDKSQGETKINEAIDLLESLDNKNTETLALLAYLQSYSIQFSPGMQAGILSRKALKNAQKSKEANPENLRAWYVLGMLDFYTPKNYGGQTECEEYLLKAIDLDEINDINPYLPTWGKDDAYALLLQYYISNDDMEKASSTFQRAMNVYPDNPTILQFSKYFDE